MGGRLVSGKAPPSFITSSSSGSVRSFAGYDWNQGVPGSRLRNPDPSYNDVYPGQGLGWWTLISVSTVCWFWGNLRHEPTSVHLDWFIRAELPRVSEWSGC